MKALFTLISMLIFSLPSFSQQPYFWSGKNKVMLIADSSQVLVKAKENVPIHGLIDKIKVSAGQATITELSIGGHPFVLIKNRRGDNIKQSFRNKDTDFQMPVFYGEEKLPYYFNGDIIFRPKEGSNLEQIRQLVDNEISFTGSISDRTYFFKVNMGEDVLDISNQIHESGLVVWSDPDFMAQIVKHHEPSDPTYGQQYYVNNTGLFGGVAGIDINAA